MDVETWTGELLDAGRKPPTVASYRRVLMLAIGDAERDGLMPRNAAGSRVRHGASDHHHGRCPSTNGPASW